MSTFRILAWCALAFPLYADFEAPRYVVDLDTPALTRWSALGRDLLEKHGWDYSFGPVVGFLTDKVPLAEWAKYDLEIAGLGLKLLGREYLEEALGLYAALQPTAGGRVTAGMLVALQLAYELGLDCTGVLATAADGRVIHGRNLDIDLPTANITVQLTWVRGGEEVMVSSQIIGYMGVHTGMRLGGWSVEQNTRRVMELGPWGWEKTQAAKNALALLMGRQPMGYMVREALLHEAAFDSAVRRLAAAKGVAPQYFVLAGAGPGEGATMSKNREGLADAPGQQSLLFVNQSSTGYLVQANTDPWVPITEEQCRGMAAALPELVRAAGDRLLRLLFGVPQGMGDVCHALTSPGRREKALALLAKLGREEVAPDSVLDLMMTGGVRVDNTVLSAVMDPQKGTYRTVVHSGAPMSRGQAPAGSVGATAAAQLVEELFGQLRAQEEEVVV